MKNYCLFIIIVVALLPSCKKNETYGESYSLVFLPRKVIKVFIAPGERIYTYNDGIKKLNHYVTLFEDSVTESQFFISILSSNYDPRQGFDKNYPESNPQTTIMPIFYPSFLDSLNDPIPSVEQQIKMDYEKSYQSSSNSGTASGKAYNNLIDVEYRTTQIKYLAISTLNTTLFGKYAGESLNDFFDIVQYDPPFIVSAPTERLVYGYSSMDYPTSIDEWLSLLPLGQATMYLVPNKKMEGLPLDVQFVVQLETTEGLFMSDTTRMITITE